MVILTIERSKKMHYNAQTNNHGFKSDPFKACVGPRPIAWLSTVSKDGKDNLAPFSQFNNLSFDPPMVMISFQHGGSEENSHRKDTLNNIEETGYFVYNIVPYELREQIFRDIVAKYGKDAQVILKPHPRDVLDYHKLFPDDIVLDGKFPMEILNFIEGLEFDQVVSVYTVPDSIHFAKEKVFLGDDFMDLYEDPQKHRFNEQIF